MNNGKLYAPGYDEAFLAIAKKGLTQKPQTRDKRQEGYHDPSDKVGLVDITLHLIFILRRTHVRVMKLKLKLTLTTLSTLPHLEYVPCVNVTCRSRGNIGASCGYLWCVTMSTLTLTLCREDQLAAVEAASHINR